MPSQHQNPADSWHPGRPGPQDGNKALADRQDRPAARVLDDGMAEYLDKHDPAIGEAAITELGTGS